MKVYDTRKEKGTLTALILVEAKEIRRDGDPGEALEAAVRGAIQSFADTYDLKLMFTRVLSADEQEDGTVMVSFEAAIAPEISLGDYRGITASASSDEEFEEKVLLQAAEDLEVEIPALFVEREWESLEMQKKSDMLQSTALNMLADLHAILRSGIRELTPDYDEEDVWARAIQTTHDIFRGKEMTMTMEELVTVVGKVLVDYGDIDEAFCIQLERIVDQRMNEQQKLTAEALAGEVFTAYLHSAKQTEEDWREANYSEAVESAKRNLLLDAVADAENIPVSEDEVTAGVQELAENFGIPAEAVRAEIGSEAIRFHLRREKARKFIVSSAVRIEA